MYRFQRRFTRAGILVMCSALLAAGLGVDLDQSLAYQLFSLLFVLMLVAVPLTLTRSFWPWALTSTT